MDRTQAIALGLIALLAVAWLAPGRNSKEPSTVTEEEQRRCYEITVE
jgi:hypothetical protein